MNSPPPLVDPAGRPVPLDRQFASGGEGAVYTLSGDAGHLAKVYHAHKRIPETVEKLRVAERELAKLRGAQLLSSAGDLAAGAEDVHGTALVAAALPDGVSGADLRSLATEVRTRLDGRPAVVALFSADDGKVSFAVATTAAGRDRGLKAGALVPVFGPAVGGRGGGKPDLAQGGGSNPAGVADAIEALRSELARVATA